MMFIDPGFLFFFLPVFLILFFAAGRFLGREGSIAALIAVSLLMAALSSPFFLGVMLLSVAVNYAALTRLLRNPDRSGRGRELVIAIGFNMLLLIVFKYAVWLGWIPALGPAAMALAALMPVSLSFLTFQRSVALLDGYQHPGLVGAQLTRDAPAGRGRGISALRFTAFATMFPNLLIGPIAYITEVVPQLARRDFGRFRKIDLAVGLTLLTIGLFKKIVIADTLATGFVDRPFDRAVTGAISSWDARLALLGYFAQLYFDFSGYTDMAIGIARMIGIRLPANFNSPLRATGIIDFYRRWHITLTRVIARFLFSPLSIAGTRFATRRRLTGATARLVSVWVPLLLNFLVIGLWHGPQVTYLMFGLIHGLWYIAETEVRRTKAWKTYRKRSSDGVRLWLGWLITVPPLILTFALFRASDLDHLLSILMSAVRSDNPEILISTASAVNLVIVFAIIWLMPNSHELLQRYRPAIITYPVPATTPAILAFRWRPSLAWGFFAAAAGLAVLGKLATPRPFVYGVF